MKIYIVDESKVEEGISVVMEPYPHIVLGQGGNKRATWVPLGKQDVTQLLGKEEMIPCPQRKYLKSFPDTFKEDTSLKCEKCGIGMIGLKDKVIAEHPKEEGFIKNPFGKIKDAGVLGLRNKEGLPSGKFLIVSSRNGNDNRVLILWRVRSGYRGSSSITCGKDVIEVAHDVSWHSGRGSLGSTAETLAILGPGQEMRAEISGRRVQETNAALMFDGKKIVVKFGGKEMESAMADNIDGDYI